MSSMPYDGTKDMNLPCNISGIFLAQEYPSDLPQVNQPYPPMFGSFDPPPTFPQSGIPDQYLSRRDRRDFFENLGNQDAEHDDNEDKRSSQSPVTDAFMDAALRPWQTAYHATNTSVFAAVNQSFDPQSSSTISPQDTELSRAAASPTSHHILPLHDSMVQNVLEPDRHRRRSLRSLSGSSESQSSKSSRSSVGRGRKVEDAEPGSARAIYLAKNRQAASKCRSKQKRHQDELVEAAQEADRKNKLLKAEVEMLKSDVRSLMGLVGQHHDCPDKRLSQYIQKEADRLASVKRV